MQEEDVPITLEMDGFTFKLAGVVYGNTYHAWAVVTRPTKEICFKLCNDSRTMDVDECTTANALIMFYKLEGRAEEKLPQIVKEPVLKGNPYGLEQNCQHVKADKFYYSSGIECP